MIDLSQKCLFCDSEQSLNTTMNVKIDDTEYKVSICEEHEDDALPKKIRELVQEKAAEIEKIREMAAKYGLTVGEAQSTPQKTTPQKTTAQPSGHKTMHPGLKPQTISKPERLEQPNDAAASPITEAPAGMLSPGTVEGAPDVHLERHNPVVVRTRQGEKVPTITARKDQRFKTESGREVTVPSVLYDDEGGKTDIRIVNSGGDRALQSRFKGMAEGSKGGLGPDFRNNYSVRDCTACGGAGTSRVSKSKPCPKCGGDGFFKGG